MATVSSNKSAALRQLGILGLVVVGILILMQFVRFIVPDFQLTNPPITHTVTWNSPETQDLFTRACADCHSNETVYPWYAYIAPMGWLIAYDTNEGRKYLNVSTGTGEVDEISELIASGEMPPAIYITMHPSAKLTEAEKTSLIQGLQQSLVGFREAEGEEGESGESESGDDD